jgi:hypothetical protein
MAAEPKPKAGRKKRRRAPREEFVDDIVEIEGWDRGYSLSLKMERHPIYHEIQAPADQRRVAASSRNGDRQGRGLAAPSMPDGVKSRSLTALAADIRSIEADVRLHVGAPGPPPK